MVSGAVRGPTCVNVSMGMTCVDDIVSFVVQEGSSHVSFYSTASLLKFCSVFDPEGTLGEGGVDDLQYAQILLHIHHRYPLAYVSPLVRYCK